MTTEDALRYIGSLVKIERKRSARHRGTGRLIGVVGRRLLVRPFGHKKDESVEPEQVSLWRAGSYKEREIQETRS